MSRLGVILFNASTCQSSIGWCDNTGRHPWLFLPIQPSPKNPPPRCGIMTARSIMALQWVQENIGLWRRPGNAHFGESAGAFDACTSCLALTAGLFPKRCAEWTIGISDIAGQMH